MVLQWGFVNTFSGRMTGPKASFSNFKDLKSASGSTLEERSFLKF